MGFRLKRYPHYWWKLKQGRFPSRIAVLDCDGVRPQNGGMHSDDRRQLVRWSLIVSDYKRGFRIGKLVKSGDSAASGWDAIRQLLSSNGKTWLFATPALETLELFGFRDKLDSREVFLAGKDWRNPTGGVGRGEDKRDALYIDSGPPTLILCGITELKGRLLIVDIRNIGIMEITDGADCVLRCERYAEGLDSCLSSLRIGGQGAFRATAGSQAMSSLRTGHAVTCLHCHTDDNAATLERAALFGGRCEAYRIGEVNGPVYHFDVRNMYPALCRTLSIPISLRKYHDTERAAKACGTDRPANTLAHVRIRTERASYPLRRTGYVLYPVGEYDCYLAGPELQSAVLSNSVTRWHSAAEYTTRPQLAGFYDHWLSELSKARIAGDVMVQQWIKRIMVSLIGKFSETCRRWIPAPFRAGGGPWSRWYEFAQDGSLVRYRNVSNNTMREEKHGESYWSIPAIAAWITAAGRVQLDAYRECAGLGSTLYCDTDSLFVDAVGYRNLSDAGHVREGEIGHLRLLGTYDRFTIRGIRHYECDGIVTCAGPALGTIQEGESRQDYFDRTSGRLPIVSGDKATGARGVIRPTTPEVYQHGVVNADGTISPFRIYDE